MKILVTGAAGFIGFHLCSKLLKSGEEVIGLDNFNSYYDPSLKNSRYEELKKTADCYGKKFQIINCDLTDNILLEDVFKEHKPKSVVNLAAQAGVRYSIENPSAYINSNLVGFSNILECTRNFPVEHLVYASSSSVYGGNTKMPFSEKDGVDHPVSLYAATKKSNELLAHSYSHLYGIPTTGLRFFTVYGPWGRPDMALFIFTKSIIERKPIKLFNNGDMIRDFTYIDDIINSLILLINKPPKKEKIDRHHYLPYESWAPYKVFNIGNSSPTPLIDYVEALENSLNIKAIKEYEEMQLGDVKSTYADTHLLEKWINYKPDTSIVDGINQFVNWYKDFYSIS